MCCRGWEQAIHDLSAAHDYRTDLLAIDGVRCGHPTVADKAGDPLDSDTRVLHKRDEAVP